MQVNSLIEQMLFCTVRITSMGPAGSASGTGFVFDADDEGGYSIPVVVTNKHVVEGATSVELHFIRKSEDDTPLLGNEVVVAARGSNFVGHPDPDIDVAVMPLAPALEGLGAQGVRLFYRSIPDEVVATPEALEPFEPIEPVTFIGYPIGLYDSSSLLPIARRGHSATALTIDYGGRPIFLIDASIFPGSSGSPVFLYVPASAPDKYGNIVMGRPPQVLLLGVLAAVLGHKVPVLHTSNLPMPYINDLINIGVVYKAAAIGEAITELRARHEAQQPGKK